MQSGNQRISGRQRRGISRMRAACSAHRRLKGVDRWQLEKQSKVRHRTFLRSRRSTVSPSLTGCGYLSRLAHSSTWNLSITSRLSTSWVMAMPTHWLPATWPGSSDQAEFRAARISQQILPGAGSAGQSQVSSVDQSTLRPASRAHEALDREDREGDPDQREAEHAIGSEWFAEDQHATQQLQGRSDVLHEADD